MLVVVVVFRVVKVPIDVVVKVLHKLSALCQRTNICQIAVARYNFIQMRLSFLHGNNGCDVFIAILECAVARLEIF